MSKYNELKGKSKWLVYSADSEWIEEYTSEDEVLSAIQTMMEDQEWSGDTKVVRVVEEYKARVVLDKLE